uniref:Anoctamin transmembrane domain-containing protein n=1 Tax=Timspurckia oligopyrenoides TaxID=708627 RepID=A0A7S0ZFM9_9RHOD|mmetsp:Transcript_3358/g.5878  ORF Transcript_3358/g.5878 Transcript_3358/m.5878 type:complete len:761 (+) Transcript_3358:164-2446(+)|eukprot:CAMPEP_0182442668 /NCGR_PEP_ID=MMETSP1172-20130603/1575_1 /TAXON_ID=708627 /ORGANISM="Timspurckia oligopyrenoides, Strain CCMP3278" /LENGTH=760 /DNA_ID=CAMNT_0024637665 /DNA_START=132 /DNA_END=2414 /DNA_ORIENTATION=-
MEAAGGAEDVKVDGLGENGVDRVDVVQDDDPEANHLTRSSYTGWDFCFVFKGDAAFDGETDVTQKLGRDANRIRIRAVLKSAGFQVSEIQSKDRNKILMRCSIPEPVMKKKAEHLGFRLRLKEEYGSGYLGYAESRDSCYVNADFVANGDSYFTAAQRVNITLEILGLDDAEGCSFNLSQEIYDGNIIASFAFHYIPERDSLVTASVWNQWWNLFWDPPFDRLRDYLGTELGLYFAFVTYLGKWLWIVSLVGIPVYVCFLVKLSNAVISALNLAYSIVMAIWSALFIEFWKRRNATLNLQWGTVHLDFDQSDTVRPEFFGTEMAGFHFDRGFVKLKDLADKRIAELPDPPRSEPDRLKTLRELGIPVNRHYSTTARFKTFIVSGFLTVFFASVAVAAQVVLLYYRDDIIDGLGNVPAAAIVPGIANGLIIVILDVCWGILSVWITNRENHRSEESYNNSLVYKRFAFQFFSNYTSLFYLAFFKPFLSRIENQCTIGWLESTPTCMSDMSFQLLTLLATRVTVSQALEVLIPYLTSKLGVFLTWIKVRRQIKKSGNANRSTSTSRYYQESNLAPYHSVMNDYNEIVILFGYVALFAVAFPLAPLLVLFNNVVEVRVDAFKILKIFQRVNARAADEIGAWEHALQVISYVSVVTNLGMLVYTSNSLDFLFGDLDAWQRMLAFFLMENILFGGKILVATIPDVPMPASKKLERQKFDIALAFGIDMKDHYKAKRQFEHPVVSKDEEDAAAFSFDIASDLSGEN